MYNTAILKKMYVYFTAKLQMKKAPNGWVSGQCPFCGKQKKFGINLSQNRSNCFSCEERKRPIEVIMQIEGFDTQMKAWQLLKAFDSSDYLEIDTSTFEKQKPKELRNCELPKGYKILMLGSSQLAKSARAYMKGRGFSIMGLSQRGIGYCDDGEYFGYIIFPYYQKGRLIYWQTRNYLANGPKFKNPKVEDFGIGKTMLMFNADALAIYRKIYVVESVTNSLTLGSKAVGILGKAISKYQFSAILRSPCKQVVIGLDPDAMEQAIDLGLRLSRYKKVKVLKLPTGYDINKWGKANTLALEKETEYLNYNQLLKLRNSL